MGDGATSLRASVLVVGGSPEPSSPELLARLARGRAAVVAVDRGADACRAAGVRPSVFVGDADTVSRAGLAWVREACDGVREFPPEKDYTDLALAMRVLRDPAAAIDAEHRKGLSPAAGALPRVFLTCASGGRPDHFLGVFGVMAECRDMSPSLVEDGFECHVIAPDGTPVWHARPSDVGRVASVVAVAPDSVASERGLRWGLDHAPMPVLSDLGISNVVESASAEVECHSGALAVFIR